MPPTVRLGLHLTTLVISIRTRSCDYGRYLAEECSELTQLRVGMRIQTRL